jgi:nucleoside-diphosphate-sugar epimerase
MNVLLTSATSALGEAVADQLGAAHHLRLTDRILSGQAMANIPGGYALSLLDHDASTNLLVRGMDAIVVAAEALLDEPATTYLDAMTRGLYNLLLAAYQEGVKRVVFLSTLELMAAYDPDYIVTERWRPRPTPEPRLLGKHLGEYVCREFAREHKLTVVVLRLGTVIQASTVTAQSVDPMWLDQADMGQAILGALTAELPWWTVLHVQGKQTDARFPVSDAERLIGYAPTVNFAIPAHLH